MKRKKYFEEAMKTIAMNEDVYYSEGEFYKGCCLAIYFSTYEICVNRKAYEAFFKTLMGDPEGYFWPVYEEGYTERIIALQLAQLVWDECKGDINEFLKPINL